MKRFSQGHVPAVLRPGTHRRIQQISEHTVDNSEVFNNEKVNVVKMIPTVLIWSHRYLYKFIIFKGRKEEAGEEGHMVTYTCDLAPFKVVLP